MRKRRQQRKESCSLTATDSDLGLFPADRALLNARQACAVLKISRRTLINWSAGRRPRLRSIKLGYARRWQVRDLLEMIEKFKIAA
jgi:hypothetical protein